MGLRHIFSRTPPLARAVHDIEAALLMAAAAQWKPSFTRTLDGSRWQAENETRKELIQSLHAIRADISAAAITGQLAPLRKSADEILPVMTGFSELGAAGWAKAATITDRLGRARNTLFRLADDHARAYVQNTGYTPEELQPIEREIGRMLEGRDVPESPKP